MRATAHMVMLAVACGSLCHVPVQAQDRLAQPVPAAEAAPSDQAMPTVQTEVIHAGGNWVDATDATVAARNGMAAASVGQRWNIDALHFSDDRISGRIGISGSDLIDSANVEGRFSGRGVRGKLLDDDGKELAEFQGRGTASGASGTYKALTGEVGEWHWEGQPKRQAAQPWP